MKPRIALTAGDPAGIGPEIVPLSLRDLEGEARIVVLGPDAVRPDWVPRVDGPDEVGANGRPDVGWIATEGPDTWSLGEVQASCGAAAVAALRAGHELATAGAVDALVTGPVNKAAMHAAGTRVEGQTELLSRWCDVDRYEMIGIAGSLRVMLATRHMPLREALNRITFDLVLDRLVLFDEALRALGLEDPSVALAGLNPHAGEGGLLGVEDEEVLRPAAEAARERGVDVRGPISPDSVFHEGLQGVHDGVLALYHDQAFIPLKLAAEGRGVTWIAGLPYQRFSPMHGTAFDIVGRRRDDGRPVADPGNLIEALRVAVRVARRRAE
ncbi:MAG: 4-hydroxythreonine-4-phosphate dehydrogenase PdxA [Planctomycetota bacterium]